MVVQLSAARPVARKQHRCSACNGVILPGQQYRRSTNIYDGRVYDWRECGPCIGLLAEVYDWAGMPDEGVTFEDFEEWAHENRDSAEAKEWLVRSGCSCGRCEATP